MSNKSSLVSIIVPTKNSDKFIDKCLSSIKKQTYKHIEIIVIDNYSTDQTRELAKKYTSFIFTKGPERSSQRNYGAIKSKGDYLLFIDSDMILNKNVVYDCIKTCKENSKIIGIIIPEESFGEGFWAQCKKLERSFYVGINWIEAARFFKKTAFIKVKGYTETLISGEDWDLSNKIKKIGEVSRIYSYIYHNEGKILLFSTVAKKLFYAKKILQYKKNNPNTSNKQFSVIERYKLFFSKPDKLFKNPAVGFGMLFMKTLELSIGGIAYTLTLFHDNEKYIKR